MTSPARNRRRTTEPRLSERNVPDAPANIGRSRRASAVICSPSCRSTSTPRLLVSAPGGQLTIHPPQPTQLDVPIGRAGGEKKLGPLPLPPRPIPEFWLTAP